ncbi:MAG: fatty acid desaturase [Pseudomonadota bacterium]
MRNSDSRARATQVEWPTLVVLVLCYAVWAVALFVVAPISTGFAIVLAGFAIALHSSLQHEILHGHPFANQRLNDALVFPSLIVVIPFQRFRDTHLAHHHDADLTDPYDDPETNYLGPASWDRLCIIRRSIFEANRTLFGRMVLGPWIAQYMFVTSDLKAIRAGDRAVLWGWLWHIPSVAIVGLLIWISSMSFWAYGLAVYLGVALLKIRTYAEHKAHEKVRGRTVIIEDRGPFALLFLNNNYHVVHHMHPRVAWYNLPRLFRNQRERYLSCNEGYYFASYAQIFRHFLWRKKDPVVHPFAQREG